MLWTNVKVPLSRKDYTFQFENTAFFHQISFGMVHVGTIFISYLDVTYSSEQCLGIPKMSTNLIKWYICLMTHFTSPIAQ